MDSNQNNLQQNSSIQEIDLIYLFKKIKNLFTDFCLYIFRCIQFLIRNKFILVLLLVLGLGLGFAFDRFMPKKYKTEVLIIPNFNSTEYLYSEIEKISEKLSLNKNNVEYMNELVSIKIKPLEGINYFMDNNYNKEFLKLLVKNGQDYESFLKNKSALQINKFHLLTITTNSNKYSEKIKEIIFDELNSSTYYKQRQIIENKNLEIRKIQLTKSIDQINSILDNLGTKDKINQKNDVNINTYDQMNLIIDLKKEYVEELANVEIKILETKQIFYPINISYNNISNKFYLKAVFILPLLLIFGFIGLKWFQNFYRKYDQVLHTRNAK